MIGAIVGDVIGSVFENENVKQEEFPLFSRHSRFTDDTVLTVAIADGLLRRKSSRWRLMQNWHNTTLYAQTLKRYGRLFPHAGYGQMFSEWVQRPSLRGYNSFGNGSAMRVSAVGFAFDSLEEVLNEAKLTALPTHNHREGIKGAQAVAAAIYLARTKQTKEQIRTFIEQRFRYDLQTSLNELRPHFEFDSSCQGTVPPALIAFLESSDFEDAIRKAISLGGDSDTIACIVGGIAQAYYGAVPSALLSQTLIRLEQPFKSVIHAFNDLYKITLD